MSLTQDFLNKYTEFESFIKKRNKIGRYDNGDYIKIDPVLRKNREKWELYRELRNLLTHENEVRNGNYIDVTEKLYRSFCSDVEKIMHPKTAMDIAIKNVYMVKPGEPLQDVINTILDKKYTCAPIVDEKGILIGIFSSQALMLYCKNYKNEFSIKNNVGKYIEYCSINNNPDIEYKFVSRFKDEFYIKDLFKQSYLSKKRLEAVFVTEHGQQNEKIIGIITNWDIIGKP